MDVQNKGFIITNTNTAYEMSRREGQEDVEYVYEDLNERKKDDEYVYEDLNERKKDDEYVYEDLNERKKDDENVYEDLSERKKDDDYVNEDLNVPPGTRTSLVKTEDEVYSLPRFHQLPDLPLPVTPPTVGDVREGQEESDYI